jgi:hypothetical protein
MRRILLGSLGVSLGLALAGARGQDVAWRTAARSGPAVAAPYGASEPAVSLGAPEPAATLEAPRPAPRVSQRVVPASYDTNPRPPVYPVTAAQNPELSIPGPPLRPMPRVTESVEAPLPSAPGQRLTPQPQPQMPFAPYPVTSAPMDFGGDSPLGAALGCGCRPNRFWAGAEYLGWFTRSDNTPALLTTDVYPANMAAIPTTIGSLGSPTATVIAGGTNVVPSGYQSGVRVYGGYWLSDCQNWGVDGTFFALPRRDSTQTFTSPPLSVLARPYQVLNTANPPLFVSPTADIIGFTGLANGAAQISSYSEFYGTDINARKNLGYGCTYRIDGLMGFRYASLKEGITIAESSIGTGPLTANGTDIAGVLINTTDSFATKNTFYGGQLGVAGEWKFADRWFLNGRAVVGLGSTHQTVTVNGLTQFSAPPTSTLAPFTGTYPTGLLAVAGQNIGSFSRDRFSYMPEFGVNVGCNVTDRLRVFVGYSVIYWSSVVRPGEQINPTVNEAFTPAVKTGPNIAPATAIPSPVLPFKATDFWAQGINFGLQWTW